MNVLALRGVGSNPTIGDMGAQIGPFPNMYIIKQNEITPGTEKNEKQ